jgi:hypothetical protein
MEEIFLQGANMLIRLWFIMLWGSRFWIMLGRVITAACLLMAKLVPESLILW